MPTQITWGFEGSIVTQPIEYEASLSKSGVQVVPAFTVFHTPPEPTATYQVLGFVGIDRDVGDAAGHERGPDGAQLQSVEAPALRGGRLDLGARSRALEREQRDGGE